MAQIWSLVVGWLTYGRRHLWSECCGISCGRPRSRQPRWPRVAQQRSDDLWPCKKRSSAVTPGRGGGGEWAGGARAGSGRRGINDSDCEIGEGLGSIQLISVLVFLSTVHEYIISISLRCRLFCVKIGSGGGEGTGRLPHFIGNVALRSWRIEYSSFDSTLALPSETKFCNTPIIIQKWALASFWSIALSRW